MVLSSLSVFSQEPGCALFAALCKEDLIYSLPMNQLTLNVSFLNINPKELSRPRTGQTIGIISWTVAR